jgi:hypothetical protein
VTVLFTVLALVGALGLSAGLGPVIVGAILRRIENGIETPGLLRGGMWIGVLERVAVTGAILAGTPEAVAIVIAIKGLGRYPELRHDAGDMAGRAAERFIVGTLASFIWAALWGFAGLCVIERLA